MKFFHIHKFHMPFISEVWEQVHREIFVEGKVETVITTTCKCGKTKLKRINVMLRLED